MSTIKDFENAPVGATATQALGGRAMKIDDSEQCWVTPRGSYLGDEGMAFWNYTLDTPAPMTAREALDLTWGLAHPVKEGQVIPRGTRYLEVTSFGLKEYTAAVDIKVDPHLASIFRTLEPLPDPEPEWTKAPAVSASVNGHPWHSVWLPRHGGKWACTCCGAILHWSAVAGVTPLYPKEADL